MYQELRNVRDGMTNYVKRYVLNLYNYLNRSRQVFPGMVGAPETGFLSYSCNVFQNRIIGLFGIISDQFVRAGINERETVVATIFEYMLPSNLRKHIFRGEDFGASKELGILAFRLRPRLFDCLAMKLGGNKKRAQELLEQCPLFASTLTEANVNEFEQTQPHVFLRTVLNIPGPSDSQGGVYGGSQEQAQRNESLNNDLLDALRRKPNMFKLPEEIDKLGVKGVIKGALMKVLHFQPLAMCSTGLDVANVNFMQHFIAGDLPRFERVATPRLLSPAHAKFLPLENLLTGLTHRLFTQVTDIIETGEFRQGELTNETVRDIIFSKLQKEYNCTTQDAFEQLVITALFGFEVGSLWNPMRCSFTPAIVFKNSTPLAVMIVNIEATTVEVGVSGLIKKKYLLPIPLVRQYVSSGIKDTLTDTANGVFGFVSNGVNKITGAIGAICQSVRPRAGVSGGVEQVEDVAVQPDVVESVNSSCEEAERLAHEFDGREEGKPVILDEDQQQRITSICGRLQEQIPIVFADADDGNKMSQEDFLEEFKQDELWAHDKEIYEAEQILRETVPAAEIPEVTPQLGDISDDTAEPQAAADAARTAPVVPWMGDRLRKLKELKRTGDLLAAAESKLKKSGFGGNSRRRKPATAKRTRRKVYNNKSNKNKRNSRKQPSRRRRSTRRK